MKNPILILGLCFFFFSCHNDSNPKNSGNKDSVKNDTLKKATVVFPDSALFLEDLLSIKDENGLKQKFGETKVKDDTIWGPEDGFALGTFVNKGTPDELEILWQDTLHHSGIASVTLSVVSDKKGNYLCCSHWMSKTGVRLGMKLSELEQINGKPFSFSGLGWDYGGGVMDWKGGKLDKTNISVTLDYDYNNKSSEADIGAISGEGEFMSDLPAAQKVQPTVWQLTVTQPQ